MYLVKMRPEEIQDAVKRNVPVLMAAGVIEYHGPHLPVGTDILIASTICEEVEKRCECILAPQLPFGPTMNWAGGPEDGEADFGAEPFFLYVKEMFKCIMDMGFRRIYVLQHHQGPDGQQSVCLKRAANEVISAVVKNWGPGWGRRNFNELPDPSIFSCIRVAYVDSFSIYPEGGERIPIGHGGKGETQLIMAGCPESVRMEALKTLDFKMPAWLYDVVQADAEEGKHWIEFCVEGWTKELKNRQVKA